MPAYNEDERIAACFHRVVKALEKYGQPFEIILEEDGSTD
ncbi:MAG: glycosyltransferase, partial [Candidatus Bathyarchaeia archaeon]